MSNCEIELYKTQSGRPALVFDGLVGLNDLSFDFFYSLKFMMEKLRVKRLKNLVQNLQLPNKPTKGLQNQPTKGRRNHLIQKMIPKKTYMKKKMMIVTRKLTGLLKRRVKGVGNRRAEVVEGAARPLHQKMLDLHRRREEEEDQRRRELTRFGTWLLFVTFIVLTNLYSDLVSKGEWCNC